MVSVGDDPALGTENAAREAAAAPYSGPRDVPTRRTSASYVGTSSRFSSASPRRSVTVLPGSPETVTVWLASVTVAAVWADESVVDDSATPVTPIVGADATVPSPTACDPPLLPSLNSDVSTVAPSPNRLVDSPVTV